MPRFAANLSMMFNEVAFPDRLAAAADAGFGAPHIFTVHPSQGARRDA